MTKLFCDRCGELIKDAVYAIVSTNARSLDTVITDEHIACLSLDGLKGMTIETTGFMPRVNIKIVCNEYPRR